jgi:hypothetical protein
VRAGKTVFAVAVAAALLASLAGCGSGGSGSSETTSTVRPPETTERPAVPPKGWQKYVNLSVGFSISIPPGWEEGADGNSALIRSPDKVVAISVTADRTGEALDAPLESYASDTLKNLDGFSNLMITGTRPYEAQYPAAIATADGTLTRSGVPERLTLVVLRREGIAAYPVLVTRNAKVQSPFVKQVDAIIHSLRGRPIQGSG